MRDRLQHPVAVMGLPINSLSADEAVDTLERLIQSGGTHQVCTMNVDIWLNALADPHLHRIVAGSSLVFPDGMPLVWASGLLGCPLAERVTGVDLVPRLAELSARKGYKIFLLGAKPGVADRASRLLERNYPGVQIVGTFAPDEDNLMRMDHTEILRKIHAVSPDILLVAFGNPKQEKWIWMHRKRLGVPLSMGVGGSFDILVGDTCRAPRWIQRCGLEWAMRFLQEPVRLGPRYLRDFAGLVRHLPMALLAAWWQRPYLGESRVTTAVTPQVLHVNIHGRLGAEIAALVQDATTASIINGLVMVVHLHSVNQVTAAGLGVLLGARRQLLEAGLSLSLAGLNLKTRFVLHAWNLQPLFDEWQPAIPQGRPLGAKAGSPVPIRLRSEQDVFPVENGIRG
ncbi:MAG TPA: WecB/TagA/CpsF family glycosyltransferase [Terracidiphilus sp.]|nr:WecB/TagA/CpsF family glycosyltransferase [Terracidiphilus sp.]